MPTHLGVATFRPGNVSSKGPEVAGSPARWKKRVGPDCLSDYAMQPSVRVVWPGEWSMRVGGSCGRPAFI